jgi:hypothetical protein
MQNDAASAQSALPKLQEVTAQIDKVDGLLGQLSPEQRKVLAGVVNPLLPSLNQLFDKVLAIPGVSERLAHSAIWPRAAQIENAESMAPPVGDCRKVSPSRRGEHRRGHRSAPTRRVRCDRRCSCHSLTSKL